MSSEANYSGIRLNIADGVARILFNRPERLNALDLDMACGFRRAVLDLCADTSVRAVVLCGAGRAFVAGGDLAYLRSAQDRSKAARDLIQPMHEGLLRLHESGLPTIAALKGPVAGAGMSLALFTDLAVAAENVTFNMAYIKVGASPDCGGTWALARLLGARKAAEIALLGETIDATGALELGLVNRIVATEMLDESVSVLAAYLAAGPSLAIRHTKRLLAQAARASLKAQLDQEMDAFAACAATEDFGEALEAFFAKRSPVFSGR